MLQCWKKSSIMGKQFCPEQLNFVTYNYPCTVIKPRTIALKSHSVTLNLFPVYSALLVLSKLGQQNQF